MKDDSQNLYISVESLRNRITNRLIPLFFFVLLITLFLSLARIPTIGFRPLMLLHVFLVAAMAILYIARKRIRPDSSALVMVGMLSSLLVIGVASLGLLSVTFVLGPIISLYLMLLGHRRSAYISIIIIIVYLSAMAILFVTGVFESVASPNLYVRSSPGWFLMIAAVGGVSIAFVAPFELVPGVLQASEARFRSMYENSSIGLYRTTPDGTIILANPTLVKKLGYSTFEELATRNLEKEGFEPSYERKQFIEQIEISGEIKGLETAWTRRDGSIVFLRESARAIRDSNGKTLYYDGTVEDITERRLAEETLKASESKLRAILDNSHDAIGVHVNGLWEMCNPATLGLFGISSANELIGTSILNVIAPNERQRITDFVHNRMEGTGAPLAYVTRGLRTDGTEFDMDVALSSYTLENKLHVHVILRDITERKRTEDGLRESESRFRQLAELAVEGIAITERGIFVDANARLAAMLGYKLGEMVGRSVADFIAPDSRALVLRHISENYEGSYEHHLLRKDGSTFLVESHARMMMWKGKTIRVTALLDITERKRAEEALYESQLRYRATVEQSNDGITIADLDGRYIMVNLAFCKMTGYTEEELLKMRVMDLVPKQTSQKLFPQVAKENKTGIRELELIRKDGTTFIALISGSSLEIDKNHYVQGIVQDITERKRAEEALTYERNLLKALMDNIPDHLYFKDKESRFLKISKSLANKFGLDNPAQVVGKTDFDFFTKEHARPAFEDEQKILKSGIGIIDLEEKESYADGRQAWVSTTKVPLRDAQGKIIGTFGISRDINARKQAEQERQRLMTAFEQTVEAIVVTDPRGIIQYVNPAFERITGFTRQEAIGQTPSIMKSGRQNVGYYENLWKTISTGRKWIGSFINKKKDGTLFTDETSISPVFNEKGEIINYVAVKRDITSELSLETQLIQAQKLESVGTLASGIAHDFNNILGIIMGHTSLLERLLENSQMYSESVAAIMKATQRGTSLVKQLMLFARKTEALLESVKINKIIEEITKLLQETFPRTITISTSLQQDLPTIVADSGQIHQVLLNLLVNARDAIEKSGTISITTYTTEGETINSRFPRATAQQYITVEIADTGIGMDEATRQRIFEPFFTTKGIGKGTGLGLAVVFGIVEHHGGFIDVRSTPGNGTVFTVYLPIPERALEELPGARKGDEQITGGTETILVIEDEEMLRNLAKTFLVSKGYTVLTAEDGMQGIELYRSHLKEIAVVLSDIGLPVLGGHDVFKKIREINPEAKVIFASGFFDPETKSELFKAGLKEFIQKPYMQDEVLKKIRVVIDSKQ